MQPQQDSNGTNTTTTTTTTLAANVNAALGLAAPIGEVCDLLRAADKVSQTMYGDLKRAALLAKDAMVPEMTPPKKVEHILAVYAPLWLEITDPNVKRDFTNLLWIYADPKAQVAVPVQVPTGAAPMTKFIDAVLVIGMSKAVITTASKHVRDIHDAGRAPGAGRPTSASKAGTGTRTNPLPNTTTTTTQQATTPSTTQNPAVSTGTLPPASPVSTTAPTLPAPSVPVPHTAAPNTQSAAAPTFFEELALRMKNPGDAAKILNIIEAEGFKVTRAANVTPAKDSGNTATTTKADATAKLAEKLLETTPETAIMQAASKAAAAKIAKEAKAAKAAASK